MRIVGGKFRHRIIQMTHLESTRETQDSVREAIFNMIGPYFDGGVCLDLFAGSGAMALEAYSRGIERIYLNDIEPKAIAVCKANAKSLGISSLECSVVDYKMYLKECKETFDLVFLDPPYKMNQIEELLALVAVHLKENAIVVFEMAKESIAPMEIQGLKQIKNKVYGIKKVVIYRR